MIGHMLSGFIVGQLEGLPLLGALSVLCCMILLIPIIIGILLAVWVYRDATKRGMNGALWLIICFFFGLIGFIVYLIVRHPVQPVIGYAPMGYPPQPVAQVQCHFCRNMIPMGSQICPICGAKLQ